MEITFVVIKPDAVARGLVGEIIRRFEQKGFEIQYCSCEQMTEAQAKELYKPHAEKEFFQGLVEFMIDGFSMQMILKRENAVCEGRALIERIRDDFATSDRHNVIHGSDSIDSVNREILITTKC